MAQGGVGVAVRSERVSSADKEWRVYALAWVVSYLTASAHDRS